MQSSNKKLIFWVLMLIAGSLACSISGSEPSQPDQSFTPTVNLTLTSVFSDLENTQAVVTATSTASSDGDGQLTESTSTPSGVSTTPVITLPSSMPTRGFSEAPSNPTTTPHPDGGPLIHAGPSVTALYISPSPIIDGDFSDWASATYNITDVVFGSGYYLNSGDISGTFQVGWDATHLFIGVEVIDNQFVQIASGEFLYLGDSIEILIDSDVSGDFEDNDLNFDDHQLGISPGSPLTGVQPEAFIWYPHSKRGPTSVVEIGVILTSTGYKIEAAIPLSIFGVFAAPDQHFGFAISISDNDAVGKYWQQTMVSNVSTRLLTDPTTWGDIVFTAP